ncbi:MAG: hypothetical protein KDB27_19740 [Planctomycetales bacterium]|nr:hypothetical protein [Planctomycetales bacterium]
MTMLRCAMVALVVAATSGISIGQLIYSESFESDGDGSRYELFDPGFEFTGDSGPGMWGLNVDAEQIGLQQNAPAKRAAILWHHDDLAGDAFTPESLEVWTSLVSWAVDGKAGATIGIFPSVFPTGTAVVADALEAAGYKVEEIPAVEDITEDLDLFIHSSELASTALSEVPVPIIAYSGGDHDDTAIAGIGPEITFFDEVSVEVPTSANGHPALGGKTGTIPWTSEGVPLYAIGKPHNGGTVLATVVYEDPTTLEEIEGPALFVIEKGDPLLGAFNPTPADGSQYLVGAALNKFGDGGEKSIELQGVDISGQSDLKLTVALAATAADFEADDYFFIEVEVDGATTSLVEFWGVNDATSDCNKGLSNGDIAGEVGDICLQTEFNDYAWDIPSGNQVVVRFSALNTWGNEIVAIDNVRISSGDVPTGPEGDFNGNGARDTGDLDLLAAAMQSGDAAFDLNGDGNVDIADRVRWVEGLANTYIGDSNFDGEFSSADFVAVFTTAKYETGQAATWGEGDWNGDGIFSSSDFVVAFSGGGYEKGARAGGLQVVPEPSSALLAIAALGMLLGVRRSR